MSKKVAFFLNNPSMYNKDYSSILEGNPGIAGSEYEFLLISYLLDTRDNGIETYLLVNFRGGLPHKNIGYCDSIKECCEYCIRKKIEILVVDIKYFDYRIIDSFSNTLSFVIWAHNQPTFEQLDQFARLNSIKKIVNCGREEMEIYRDHIATLKSTYIFNIVPVREKSFYDSKIQFNDNHNVVYMGSLVNPKGFHVLARVWKKILKVVPDAQLFVIGNGRLYDSDTKLGSYGIASTEYENEFVPWLIDEKGVLLPSVHFLGLLGMEKYEVMGKCKVGVPNPTGNTETFCLSAIEMQLMGCNITTIMHPAYLDTVYNHNYLYKTEKHLLDYLTSRLMDKRDAYINLFEFVSGKFGVEKNICKWESLLTNLDRQIIEPCSKHFYIKKSIKTLLLKSKMHFPYLNKMIPMDILEKKVRNRMLQFFQLD